MILGDICQQFSREIFDMYRGFACYKNWEFEVYNYTPAEYGKSCVYLLCENTANKLLFFLF